jgi:hypothetical protein
MGTDLFGKYYNNPTKSYIYANMYCNGESGDELSFDITRSDAVISNNEDVLSTLGLDEVHVGLTQYTNDMKIINPYEMIYVKGIEQGDSYTVKAYGILGEKSTSIPDWMYKTTMILHIKYVDQLGLKVIKCVTAGGSFDTDKTFIEVAQEIFDEAKIPITISYEKGCIYFTATELGYDFWVSHIELWHYLGDGNIEEDFPELFEPDQEADPKNNLGFGYDGAWAAATGGMYSSHTVESVNAYTTPVTEEQYREIYNALGKRTITDASTEFVDLIDVSTDVLFNVYLFEDLTKHIPCKKYRNGAMKGCVVLAKYPQFNAESITTSQKALKIGHLVDRVEEYYTSPQNEFSGLPMYVRIIRDVVDSYYAQYEFDVFKKWSNGYSYMTKNDSWIDPGEIPVVNLDNHDANWTHSHVPNYYMLNTIYKDEAKYEAIGLYGYATYLSKHNGWDTMGQLYVRTTVEDDESTNMRNLIPSFIIYNPNPFPVQVKYMTFV